MAKRVASGIDNRSRLTGLSGLLRQEHDSIVGLSELTADVSSASVGATNGSGPAWNSRVGSQSIVRGLMGQAGYRLFPTPVRPIHHQRSFLAQRMSASSGLSRDLE